MYYYADFIRCHAIFIRIITLFLYRMNILTIPVNNFCRVKYEFRNSCFLICFISSKSFNDYMYFHFFFLAFMGQFLESLSNQLWIKTFYDLFQRRSVENAVLEKLSIVLQRLSKIK